MAKVPEYDFEHGRRTYYAMYESDKVNVISFHETFMALCRAERINPLLVRMSKTAPWHYQFEVEGVMVNVWPHKFKAQCGGNKSLEGASGLAQAIRQAQAYAKARKDHDVLES